MVVVVDTWAVLRVRVVLFRFGYMFGILAGPH